METVLLDYNLVKSVHCILLTNPLTTFLPLFPPFISLSILRCCALSSTQYIYTQVCSFSQIGTVYKFLAACSFIKAKSQVC